MNILFITPYPPCPPVTGYQIRIYNLIKRLARHHRIWLLTFDDYGFVTPDTLRDMQTLCAEVIIARRDQRPFLRRLGGVLSYPRTGTPWQIRHWESAHARQLIQELCRKIRFDVVHIEDSPTARYWEYIPHPETYGVFITLQDVVFDKFRRMVRTERGLRAKARRWLYARTMAAWEPRYMERFDRCLVMSQRDGRLLQAHNARLHIEVVPNGVDTQLLTLLPDQAAIPRLLFMGILAGGTNVDAVLYFHRQVLPLIQKKIPQVDLWIAGHKPCPEILQLAGERVRIIANPDSVVPCYAACTVAVVPLRAGGGTKLKILEAMALGRPVITTTIGAEGIDAVAGQSILIADDPAAMAAQTVNILTDADRRRQIALAGRRLVERHYDWTGIADHLMEIYAAVAGAKRRQT